MGRKKRPHEVWENLLIESCSNEGMGIARKDGKVVFVKGAVPGDVVDADVFRFKKQYAEARLKNLVTPSPKRVDPKCAHFGVCGGCKWQNFDYQEQLKVKEDQVINNIQRIGKKEGFTVQPIQGCNNPYYYRNKLEFSFSDKGWLTDEEIKSEEPIERNSLGFHVPGKFDRVLNVDHCWLQTDPSNEIRIFIRNHALKHQAPFFNFREQTGLLRNVIVRNNIKGEFMVVVVFTKADEYNEILLSDLGKSFKAITSLMYVHNNKKNDTIHDLEVFLYKGEPKLTEELKHPTGRVLKYEIGPKSFFQTNTTQAQLLYSLAFDMAQVNEDMNVYDLYTGTGSIALYFAPFVKQVVGIEYVEEAVVSAKSNAQMNQISNAEFFAGDMKDILSEEFIKTHKKPDLIITDPPRAGMHENVVKCILNSGAETVLYISCNSATQARDVEWLSAKYDLKTIAPVDMFPHTHHVENVALLKLKK